MFNDRAPLTMVSLTFTGRFCSTFVKSHNVFASLGTAAKSSVGAERFLTEGVRNWILSFASSGMRSKISPWRRSASDFATLDAPLLPYNAHPAQWVMRGRQYPLALLVSSPYAPYL